MSAGFKQRQLGDSRKQQLAGLIAEHSLMYSQERSGFTNFTDEERNNFRPVPQVIVRTLPESERRTLYLASHIGRIRGMADDVARALVAQLIAHATPPQFVYRHRWRIRDLVIWDDRCTMHRGSAYADLSWVREMRRATVADPVYDRHNHARKKSALFEFRNTLC